MRTESKKLLFDIVDACRATQEFNGAGGLVEHAADAMRRAATERKFEIIGEAMIRLRETDLATATRVPESRAIIGFRNRLIHGYDLVDDEVVWGIILDRVPELLRAADALLEEPDSAGHA